MLKNLILTLTLFLGSASLSTTTLADTETGFYLSGGLGLGYLDFSSIGLTKKSTDNHHPVGRVSAGYRFTKHWGIAFAYSRIGHFKNKYATSDSTVFYSGTAHAAWLALTARLPVGERFALLSDIKLARNWVHTDKKSANVSQFSRLNNAKTALVLGAIGAEYTLDRNSSVNLQLEGFGETADAVEANILTLNYQYHF